MNLYKNFFLITFLLSVSACKIAGSQRPTGENPESTVLTYFVSEQYAIDTPGVPPGETIADAMSSLFGIGLVSSLDANFSNWSSPQAGCIYSVLDGLTFEPKRSIDIGNVSLLGYGTQEVELPKDDETKTFSAFGRLPFGGYELKNTGIKGSLAFNQAFLVPEASPSIELLSGGSNGVRLASPSIPYSSDSNYKIIIKKNEPLLIQFSAPPKANYIRVRISDGTQRDRSSVTCYGALNESLLIPQAAFNYFRSTDDGIIYIDFVSVSINRSVPKIKESLVLSYVRHLHGLVDFQLKDTTQTERFGVLSFE